MELLHRFRFRVRGREKYEKLRFVFDIWRQIVKCVCLVTNSMGKNEKTFMHESAIGGHLFTICARFADVCMVLQNVKGLGLFCGA